MTKGVVKRGVRWIASGRVSVFVRVVVHLRGSAPLLVDLLLDTLPEGALVRMWCGLGRVAHLKSLRFKSAPD